MTVDIKKIAHDKYLVNGKTVYKDTNGNWISVSELTIIEISSFQAVINALGTPGAEAP